MAGLGDGRTVTRRNTEFPSTVVVVGHRVLPREIESTQTNPRLSENFTIEVEAAQGFLSFRQGIFINLVASYEKVKVNHGRYAGHHLSGHVVADCRQKDLEWFILEKGLQVNGLYLHECLGIVSGPLLKPSSMRESAEARECRSCGNTGDHI